MDPQGYPDDIELRKIRNWKGDVLALLEFVRERWKYPEYWTQRGRHLSISTGGWSGNESLIYEMERSKCFFWALCWKQSNRGGHYKFEIPKALMQITMMRRKRGTR